MKRILALMVTLVILLVVGAPSAFAGHKLGHQTPPSCDQNSPNKPQGGPQNKHCYPPREGPPAGRGISFNFPAEAEESGFTVGMATMVAAGALGVLLIARRRWVFRTDR